LGVGKFLGDVAVDFDKLIYLFFMNGRNDNGS